MSDSNVFEFDVSKVKGKKVMVATPMYGGMGNAMFFSSLLRLQDQLIHRGAQMHHAFMSNESLIDRGRNGLVDTFLTESDADYMLFIDADVEFRPEDVLVMLCQEKDIICGPYPKKHINWPVIIEAVKAGIEDPSTLSRLVGEYVFTPLDPETKMEMVVKVAEAGTGLMLIHRSVFHKMKEAFPENYYISDDSKFRFQKKEMHAYFRTMIVDNRYLSEDYYFCHKWRELGGDVWLFPWAQTTHYGTYGFQGSVGDLMNLIRRLEAKAKEASNG
jgi:hypothetical protein